MKRGMNRSIMQILKTIIFPTAYNVVTGSILKTQSKISPIVFCLQSNEKCPTVEVRLLMKFDQITMHKSYLPKTERKIMTRVMLFFFGQEINGFDS